MSGSAIFAAVADAWAAMRAEFDVALEAELEAAEVATNGNLLRPAYRGRVDAASLFVGPRARAERYASDELVEWWQHRGRLTLAEFERGWLDARGGELVPTSPAPGM